MSKTHLTILGILFSLLLVGVFVTYHFISKEKLAIEPETQKLFAGTENEATYTDINGNPISLEQFLGKVLVVTTWASWSPFSEADLTKMNAMSNDYDKNSVVFMAINRKETREQAQRYVASLPALDNLVVVIDQEDFFYKSVGGYAMPESLVFDKNGNILDHTRGIFDEEKTRSLINEQLK